MRFITGLFGCLILLLVSTGPGLTQSTTSVITGLIVDQRNSLPIPGASVVLSQAGNRVGVTQTDASGRYTIGGVAPGLYDVSINAHGYSSAVSTDVVVTGGSTLTLNTSLVAAQTSSNTSYRTIGSVSTSSHQALAAATTISQSVSVDNLLSTGQFRVFDQLQTLPSINGSTSSSPGDDAKVDIRGFGPTETAVLLNGHPVGPLGVKAPDSFNFSDTPSFGLSGVTVTYGSGAQGLYGSDTVAGAIDFQTLSPTVKPQFEYLQSIGGFGILSSGFSATGTYGKLGYATAFAVQGTSGSYNGEQVFQSARPALIVANVQNGVAIGGSVNPTYQCSNYNGNDVSACNQAQETYAIGQDTKLTTEFGELRYNFSPSTAFQTSFYSGIALADSTGNGDNDNLPYSSRLANIQANSTPNCNSGTGYTVVTNPITNATACYSAQQWAAASSGPDGGGTGRDRSTSMRDYDFRFTTQEGINNITLDAYINNYYFWKNSVQSGGTNGAGGFIGTPDYTDYFNTHGYLISDDIATGKNDVGFGYSLINQLQTSFGFAANGPIDPTTTLNSLINIPDYNFPTSYESEGSGFVRDNYQFNDQLSVFANLWLKQNSVTQKTTFDPRVTALVHATPRDVFRLTYGRSDGAPAAELKAAGVVQVTNPGSSLTSVNCNQGGNSVGNGGDPYLLGEWGTDWEAGYGHRFKDDSNIQVNAYVTNLKEQLQGATVPVEQYGLNNINFQGGALGTYIARLNANGCSNGAVNTSNVYQYLGVTTTFNLGNQLARGIEISGRERINRIAYIDYGYYTESTQNFNLPYSVLAYNATLINGGQVAGAPLHQGTISLDVAPGPWDFRIDNFYTEQNNGFDRPSYWYSNAFLTRSFNHGKTLITLGGTNIFNQNVQLYGYIGQGTFTNYNPVYAAVNGVKASNALEEYVTGINSNEEFGLTPAQLTLTLTERI